MEDLFDIDRGYNFVVSAKWKANFAVSLEIKVEDRLAVIKTDFS